MVDPRFVSLSELRTLMDADQKIECIKILRAMTGAGLHDAKDFFEQEWLPFVNGTKTPPKVVRELVSDSPEFEELARQVQRLTEEVDELKSRNVKSMASGLFN